jgi:uncharacterized membrane protein/predicted DsbA family dithiol-disulfide isomerase
MRFSSRLFVVRLAALAGLAVSAALFADRQQGTPLLCGAGGSCETVLSSEFASVLGLPLPLLGTLGFAGVLLAALFPGTRLDRLRAPLAWALGAVGLGLLFIQFLVLRAVCPFCLVADVSALVIAVADPGRAGAGAAAPRRWLWLAAAGAVVGVPLAWEREPLPEPAVPPEVAALWVPGKINVVEVSDFECPFCRELDPVLTRVLKQYGDRVHFVRLNVPLPSHPQGRDAARAYYCARAQGSADRMARALFAADDLSPAACLRLARRLGLSIPAYKACVASPDTDRAIDAALHWFKKSELPGLPAVWIQEQLLVGVQTEEELQEALREAEKQLP